MKTILKSNLSRWVVISALASLTPAYSQSATAKPNPAQESVAYHQKGLAAEKAGDPEAAKAAYEKALQLNPRNANARYNLGQLKTNYAAIAKVGREAKFNAIMIPEFNVAEADFKDCIDALKIAIHKASNGETSTNFLIQDSQESLSAAKISLSLKNTPAGEILKYINEQAGAKARFDEYAIIITPR